MQADPLALLSAHVPPAYMRGLFHQQRAFVEDDARRKAALCGRRAGKTEGLAAWLLDGARRAPGETSLYITISAVAAANILWTTLRRIDARHGLGLVFRQDRGQLHVVSRGHTLWLAGCPDASEAEKFRGGRYRRVAIDEAQAFGSWLEPLVYDVLEPSLLDLQGDMALCGTPGLSPVGLFHAVTTGGWPTHRWTSADNPHVEAGPFLAEIRRRNGWDESHPTYRREYLGEWIHDDEARVYPYDAARNVGGVPDGDGAVRRVLSVDLGSVDATAFVLSSSRVGHPECYVERAWKRTGGTVAHVAGWIEQVRKERRLSAIVIDEGALGKMIADDLRDTYGIPCERAEKRGKAGTIHQVRGALLAGTIRVEPRECQQLLAEWAACAWNEARDDHDERCPDDLCDALLYGWRAHALHYSPREAPPPAGTPAALDAEMAAHKRSIIRAQAARLRRDSGWFGR